MSNTAGEEGEGGPAVEMEESALEAFLETARLGYLAEPLTQLGLSELSFLAEVRVEEVGELVENLKNMDVEIKFGQVIALRSLIKKLRNQVKQENSGNGSNQVLLSEKEASCVESISKLYQIIQEVRQLRETHNTEKDFESVKLELMEEIQTHFESLITAFHDRRDELLNEVREMSLKDIQEKQRSRPKVVDDEKQTELIDEIEEAVSAARSKTYEAMNIQGMDRLSERRETIESSWEKVQKYNSMANRLLKLHRSTQPITFRVKKPLDVPSYGVVSIRRLEIEARMVRATSLTGGWGYGSSRDCIRFRPNMPCILKAIGINIASSGSTSVEADLYDVNSKKIGTTMKKTWTDAQPTTDVNTVMMYEMDDWVDEELEANETYQIELLQTCGGSVSASSCQTRTTFNLGGVQEFVVEFQEPGPVVGSGGNNGTSSTGGQIPVLEFLVLS